MLIGSLQKLTLVDYPGKLACAVFLVGCNYRCPWCSSSGLVLLEKMKNNPMISEKNFFKFLEKRKEKLEGVCLGGGEPTVHKDLPGFCQRIKKMGYKVKLTTNGSNPAMLQHLIKKKLVDCIALDVKAPKEKYAQTIGFQDCSPHYLLSKVELSINILKKSALDYEFCTTLTPLLNKEDILKIVHWLQPAKRYCLQTFQPENTIDPLFRVLEQHPQKLLFEIQQAIAPFFESCYVR